VVFVRTTDPLLNGGVPGDYAFGSAISLGNTSDVLSLEFGATVFDTVAWDGGITFPNPTGASMALDRTSTDAVLNDDGTRWCEGTDPYGLGDLGTPGTLNRSCAVVGTDADGDGFDDTVDCDDGATTPSSPAPPRSWATASTRTATARTSW
jgi:hypothetical protein